MFSTDGFELTKEQRVEISEASETLERLRASRRVHVSASSCVGLVSWAFDSYLQLGLHRIVSLGDGIASEWNAMRVVNGVILTRSLIETVSAWWHLLDRARALIQKGDVRGAHGLAIKALFGMRYKQPGDEQFPDSTNALTMVDRLDKAFPGVRHFYDSICEIVHPNSAAIFLFGDGDLEKHELILDERRAAREQFAIGKVLFGFRMFEIAEKCLEAYQKTIKGEIERLESTIGPNPYSVPAVDKPPENG